MFPARSIRLDISSSVFLFIAAVYCVDEVGLMMPPMGGKFSFVMKFFLRAGVNRGGAKKGKVADKEFFHYSPLISILIA